VGVLHFRLGVLVLGSVPGFVTSVDSPGAVLGHLDLIQGSQMDLALVMDKYNPPLTILGSLSSEPPDQLPGAGSAVDLIPGEGALGGDSGVPFEQPGSMVSTSDDHHHPVLLPDPDPALSLNQLDFYQVLDEAVPESSILSGALCLVTCDLNLPSGCQLDVAGEFTSQPEHSDAQVIDSEVASVVGPAAVVGWHSDDMCSGWAVVSFS
jgi:hypothetical protein